MSWQQYDLTFRLLAPLHIGWRKTSNLQQTRGYVPGHVFWAALTARLTREAGRGANAQAYQKTGNLVQQHFRFTYFYPALQCGNSYSPHYPWQDDFDFDYHFLDSYASAALNYTSQSAEDGLLHETEFIAPHTRTNQPVYLTGSLYVQTNLPESVQNWQNALNKLQFGGERGYGWGRVQLAATPEGKPINGEPAGSPIDGRITAHLIAHTATNVTGPIEPLIGWEHNNETGKPNWTLSKKATICYAPGSTTATTTFTIGDYGRWHTP